MKLDKNALLLYSMLYSEKTISLVVEDIFQAFPQTEYNYEIILVNDGSKDNTFTVIKELAKKHPQVISINLAKNFGQDAALMAGIYLRHR